MLYYHHCRSLESIVFEEVKANPKYFDPHFKDAYLWLKRQINFYPIFLAVGSTEEDIRMTGYQNQWQKIVGTKIIGRRKNGSYIQENILRKKGEFPDDILFSFEEVEGIFMDFEYWHLVLNASTRSDMSDYEKKLIFKHSWTKLKWLRKAKNKPGSVQLVTSSLYLPTAKRIFVRNKKTKKVLDEIGFNNVEVKRIYIE